MAGAFRFPHRADSLWKSIMDGDEGLFQQIVEENNRAVEDGVVNASQSGGTLFAAAWTTSDSADPVLTDTTNCTELPGLPPGSAGVYPDELGVYTVHVTHIGDGNTTALVDSSLTTGYPASSGTNCTVSGTFLLGPGTPSEAGLVILPGSDAVGTWNGTLEVFGFKVGEAADFF